MSKADAIAGLMESGIEVFSRLGYEGASLRDIAARAGVPLSTIHRYFGSKADLYAEIEQHVFHQINDERERRLNEALAETPLRLEPVLRALIAPVVERALGDEHKRPAVLLMRSSVMVRRQMGREATEIRDYRRMTARWLSALGQAEPGLSPSRIVWAFSFAVGSIYSWQLFDHQYDAMLEGGDTFSAAEITDMLVGFCCGGFDALAHPVAILPHTCGDGADDRPHSRHGAH